MKFVLLILLSLPVPVVFAEARIESEYKLVVPSEKVEATWEYLKKHFSGKGEFSTEYFTDIYYDNQHFDLLKNNNCIRRRIRTIPDDLNDPKNERSLIQFKLSGVGASLLNRSEIKFDVRDKYKHAHYGTHALLLLQEQDKPYYLKALKNLRLKEEDLIAVLVMTQTRRRIYLTLNDRPFATISLDEARSQKWWAITKFSEIELELNENAYTQSDLEGRRAMDLYLENLKKKLEMNLPYVRADLTPKYNKMWHLITKRLPFYPHLIKIESWFH